MISNANYLSMHLGRSNEPIMFEVLDYKTNATNADISLIVGEDNFPVMTEDNYGEGRLFILNVPENFADLYKLPSEVIRAINKHTSWGQRVYLAGQPKFNLLAYDNNVYGIVSYRSKPGTVQVIVRGECKGLREIESGRVFTEFITLPRPAHMGDATTVIDEPTEYQFEIPLWPGMMMFFEVID